MAKHSTSQTKDHQNLACINSILLKVDGFETVLYIYNICTFIYCAKFGQLMSTSC